MQNRLPSWPPWVNQIRTNTEAFNSISRQPEVVFKAHVVCSTGTTPVFWNPNSISSLTKERFDFTEGRQPRLKVNCQDRPLCFSRGIERSHKHTFTHTQTSKQIHTFIQTYPDETLSGYMVHNTDSDTQTETNKTWQLHSVLWPPLDNKQSERTCCLIAAAAAADILNQ